jgi:large subunit ribosomal protein L24
MKIKKGDKVMVRIGKDKGKTGIVLETFREAGKVLVEGVNMKTFHIKAKSETVKGFKQVKSAPMQAANVSLVDTDGKVTRVGYKLENGKMVRIAKKSDKII